MAYYSIVNTQSAHAATPSLQPSPVRFYLLGPMRIERDGERIHLPRRKVESLLAYLLLHPARHTRDQLATLFWGDFPDAQARHSLRTALATVRQQISPNLLLTDREHVQLNPDFCVWIDLHDLLALEKEFDDSNSELLQTYLALWQGQLVEGIYDEWASGAREYYQTRLINLFLQMTHRLRARSNYAQAIAVAQRVLTHEPANEHAHQHLMFCYVASGDRPAALRQYEICERALAEDLDTPPLSETTALYHWIKQHAGDTASTAAKITNLPLPLSTFVGRTRETAELKRLLTGAPPNNAVRLLTLIGAGGSGKTRLAIHVATDLIDRFTHGVWWVELAAYSDGALVASAVAKTLGVNEASEQFLSQRLADFINNKALLLVLDNCEHLVESCARLSADLLAKCPNLQILTTSREALNITGERLWQVPTFAVPNPANLTALDLLHQYESVRLFVDRATAVQPTFALTLENAQAVAEICHQLDGIPLALELAAARIRLLTPAQIADYLSRSLGARFALLTQGSRTAMPRHQTLRATIDWSYDLLDAAERRLFRQVAVFRGGFTLEMLERVIASESTNQSPAMPELLDLLTQLVNKSLVSVDHQPVQLPGQPPAHNRYRLLETLREYALAQYPTPEERAKMQQQHAAAFLHIALQAEPEVIGAQQHNWLNHLEAEHDNFRAALEFLATVEGEETIALRLATALHRFWEVRGYVREGRSWLAKTLAKRASTTFEVQANALNAAGRLAHRLGDLNDARRLYEEALTLFERDEEEAGIADALTDLARIDMDQGNYREAHQRAASALEICRRLNYQGGIAAALSRLGHLAWDQDQFAESYTYHNESLQIYQKLNRPLSVAYQLLYVGDTERMLGNFEASRVHYETCLTLARDYGYRGLSGMALKSLGLLASMQTHEAQAHRYLMEALHIFRELGDRVHAAFSLSHLGEVARKTGEYHQALIYFGEYLQIMVEVGYKWPTFYALEDIADLLTHVNQHMEAAARFLGAADAIRQQTGLAIAPTFQPNYERMCHSLAATLGAEHFTNLRQIGATTPLDQIVTEVRQLSIT